MSVKVELQSAVFQPSHGNGQKLSFQDCFLCGSRNCSSRILEENRKKWTQHFCQLYSIDISVSLEEFVEIQRMIQNGFYCFDCLTELESISQFYKTIEDINAQLKVIQLQYELKVKSSVESLEQQLENMKEISTLGEDGEDDDDGQFFSEVYQQKQQLLKCMTACCRPGIASLAASVSKTIFPKNADAKADQDYDEIHFEDGNDHGDEPLDPSDCVQTCQNKNNKYERMRTKFNLKNVSIKVDRIQIKTKPKFKRRKVQVVKSRKLISSFSSLKRKKPSQMNVPESSSESESNSKEIKTEINTDFSFDSDESKSSSNTVEEIKLKKNRRPKKLKPTLITKRRFQCEFCGKPYKTQKAFKNHVRNHEHENDGETSGNKPSGPAFKCETCGKPYNDQWAYKCHLLTHDESHRENLACKHCHKVLSNKHQLKLHEQRVHTGNFGFKCDQCSFGAVDNGTLQHHLSTVHSDARPFECDICQHTFKTRSYMNRHKKLIHPVSKDFVCSSCGKCFSNKRYLQEHEETHKEVKSFLCPECGKYFTQKTSLKKHMGKVHGNGSV